MFVIFIYMYHIIYNLNLKGSTWNEWDGFNNAFSYVEELNWTLNVIKGEDPGTNKDSLSYAGIWHEWQHNRNTYFAPDKNQSKIARAKDEITAFQRDWRSIEETQQILTDTTNYTYNLKWISRYKHKLKV